MKEAVGHIKAKQWEKSMEKMAQCAQLEPQNAIVRWNFGVTLQRLHDYEGALLWMEDALSLDPENLGYLEGLGTTALSGGEPDRAVEVFTKDLELRLNIAVGSWPVTLLSVGINNPFVD